jgi:hypothetical protein
MDDRACVRVTAAVYYVASQQKWDSSAQLVGAHRVFSTTATPRGALSTAQLSALSTGGERPEGKSGA